jgi:hypothetical protein
LYGFEIGFPFALAIWYLRDSERAPGSKGMKKTPAFCIDTGPPSRAAEK